MKTNNFLLIALIICSLITSCSKHSDEEIVKDNVIAFSKALYTGNYNKAIKYCTADAVDAIKFTKSSFSEDDINKMQKTKPVITIQEVTFLSDSVAVVKCSLKNTYDMNSETNINDSEIQSKFLLLKRNNKWLIN